MSSLTSDRNTSERAVCRATNMRTACGSTIRTWANFLKALDDLGVTKDTIVIYTTDNGPNMFSWPDAAMTPFRSEKDSNWEGAFRVPAMIRWPGHIKPGVWSNQIVSGLDWFPTLLAAAGDTTVKDRLLKGWATTSGGYVSQSPSGRLQHPSLSGGSSRHIRREKTFFTSMTTDNWWPCATKTGSLSL